MKAIRGPRRSRERRPEVVQGCALQLPVCVSGYSGYLHLLRLVGLGPRRRALLREPTGNLVEKWWSVCKAAELDEGNVLRGACWPPLEHFVASACARS